MKKLLLLLPLLLAACDGSEPEAVKPVAWKEAESLLVVGQTQGFASGAGRTRYVLVQNGGQSRLARSADGGATWQAVDSTSGTPTSTTPDVFRSLAVEGDDIVVGTNRGFRISRDAARTWTSVTIGTGRRVFALHASPLLAAVEQAGPCRLDIRSGACPPVSLGADYPFYDLSADGERAYVAAGVVGTSRDGGRTWSTRSLEGRVVSVAMGEGRVVYAGTSSDSDRPETNGVFRSDDGGETWARTGLAGEPVQTLLAGSGRTVFAGGRGGVWRSLDQGTTWEDVTGVIANGPPSLSSVRVLEQDPDGYVWVGTRSTLFRSTEKIAR